MARVSMRLCYIYSRYARRPRDGKQVQLFKFLTLISPFFHRIEVLGLARSEDDLAGSAPELPSNVRVEEMIFAGSYDLQVLSCLTATFPLCPFPSVRKINSWISSRDEGGTVFLFEGLPLAGFLRIPRQGAVYWGEVDSYLRRAHRLAKLKPKRGIRDRVRALVARYVETVGLKHSRGVHVYSIEDAKYLRRIYKRGNIAAIPMIFAAEIPLPAAGAPRERPRVLVWADGKYGYLEAGLRRVLDTVNRERSKGVADYIFLIGDNEKLGSDIRTAGWEVHSRVDQLDALVRSVDFVLLPDLSGTGIKNRTLYALARGVCVLATKVGWEGVPIRDGIHGVVIRDLDAVGSVVLASNGSDLRRRMSEAGRQLVANLFDPSVVGPSWQRFLSGRAPAGI